MYAHTAYRHWESDTDVLNTNHLPSNCEDIARQLILGEVGQKLKVIMGGGRKKFIPKKSKDEDGMSGDRSDNLDLIKEWIHQKENVRGQYVSNREELLSVGNHTEFLLGKFKFWSFGSYRLAIFQRTCLFSYYSIS